jgi:hypothetical protein
MLFHLRHRLQDELDPEAGNDLGGTDDLGEGGEEFESSELQTPAPWEEPLGSLRESVSAMEGRFGEQLSPLQQQLQEVQQSLGKQTAVEVPDDKIAAIEALFVGSDPQFEGIGDLLRDLLTSSVKQTPFDDAALRPHLEQFGNSLRYEQATNWLNDVVSPGLSFDQDALVNEGDPQSPSTDLQRAWLQFWNTASAAQRQALTSQRQDGSVAYPREFGQAMLAFDKRWKKLSQEKNESAGSGSRRLAGAAQTRSSGRSSNGSGRLRSEEDGWNSVFAAS